MHNPLAARLWDQSQRKKNPKNGTRTKGRDSLSPNLEPEKSLGTLKVGPKELTQALDSEHTKDICPGPKVRVKKVKRTKEKKNTV